MSVEYKISKLTEQEKKEIGVFLSYSRKNEDMITEIIDYFDDVNVISDRMLNASTKNFFLRLNDLLENATCGIVVGNDYSPWVMYEIGRLKAMNKKIYVYKGEKKAFLEDCIFVDNLEELKKLCKKHMLFFDLFTDESYKLKREAFLNKTYGRIDYMSLEISIRKLNGIDKSAFRFGYIIPQMFRSTIKDVDEYCYKTGDDFCDCSCKAYNLYKKCPYITKTEPGIETVLINKIYHNFRINEGTIKCLIPVHKEFGVTFKCFVDILDFSKKDLIIEALEDAGIISIGESISALERIYFLLPKKPMSGLFTVKEPEGFENNYICPGALD